MHKNVLFGHSKEDIFLFFFLHFNFFPFSDRLKFALAKHLLPVRSVWKYPSSKVEHKSTELPELRFIVCSK